MPIRKCAALAARLRILSTLNIAAENSKHTPRSVVYSSFLGLRKTMKSTFHASESLLDAWFNCASTSGTLPTNRTLHTVTRPGTEGFKAASNGWRILPMTDSYTHLMRQLSLRLPADKTRNLKGNPCNGSKNSKERITVALAYNACGNDEHPAFVSRQQ
jgi:hypothetical protein